MIPNLPNFISIIFVGITLVTLLMFCAVVRASPSTGVQKKWMPIFIGLSLWLVLQAILGWNQIYSTNTEAFPPKIFLFGIFPSILLLLYLFTTSGGQFFIDNLPLKHLTYLNVVRIGVELVLYWLFLHKTVPELMTFEGRNFDIFAGITAPFVAYFGWQKKYLSRSFLIIWNLICLGLLINIVANSILAAPSPIQKFAYDQPNIAILYFPFCWLPTFIVPIILLGHLTSIQQLKQNKSNPV